MKKALYTTAFILLGFVLGSLVTGSNGKVIAPVETQDTQLATTQDYNTKIPKFTNNEEKVDQEIYFKNVKNLDQLYFYNLDDKEDLEAVTYEHVINNENKMQEWEGTINIYKKSNNAWTKVYSYNLIPTPKGDESYFDLRGYIIPLTENKPELLVQDSTNGSGMFTKQVTLNYENGEYLVRETPLHQTNPFQIFN